MKDWVEEDGSRYIIFLYKTDQFEGTLHSSEEGEVFWTELEDMKRMQLADSMETQLQVFLNDALSEDYNYKENGEWVNVLK